MYDLCASESTTKYSIRRFIVYDIELITLSIGIPVLFSLYLLFRMVEYRESVKRLQWKIDDLREANKNLANIIQEDIEKKSEFEDGCG